MIGPLLKLEIEGTFQVMRDRSTDEELVILCPECGDRSGNRSINLRSGTTFCWRCNKGANNKGNFLAWARALGHRFSATSEHSSVSISQLFEQELVETNSKVPVLVEVKLPNGFIPIAREPKSAYTKWIGRMARRKNLDYEDFVAAGVGFTRDEVKWEPFAIFPVTEHGMNVYYQGRTYVDVPDQTTKRFPSRHEVKYGASFWVYNLDEVRKRKPKTVVIVESILNVLSLKREFADRAVTDMVPVCVFKHYVSKVQAIKLLQCEGVEEFCMLFDRDAIDQTWKIMGSLGGRRRLTIAEMPFIKGQEKLDANDDVLAAWEAIEGRTRYTGSTMTRHFLSNEPNSMSDRSKLSLVGKRISSNIRK